MGADPVSSPGPASTSEASAAPSPTPPSTSAATGGARAIQGYPITTTHVITEELNIGTVSVFADAGLTETPADGRLAAAGQPSDQSGGP